MSKLTGKAKAKARKMKQIEAQKAEEKSKMTMLNIHGATPVKLYQADHVAQNSFMGSAVFHTPEGKEATDTGMFIANMAYYQPNSNEPDFTGNTNKGICYVVDKKMGMPTRNATMHHVEVGKAPNSYLLQITAVGHDGSKEQHLAIIGQAIKSLPADIQKKFVGKNMYFTKTTVNHVGLAGYSGPIAA